MSERNPGHDLGNLFSAHEKVARWSAERENASARLEIESIKERMWELHSQHEPLASLTNGDREERERTLNAIFYVVVGRFRKE